MDQITDRHPMLPAHLTEQELQQFIMRSSVERYRDKTKRYFTSEQIAEFEHESSANGRFINRLKTILKQATEAVNKGCIEDVTIVIPKNEGSTNYDNFRRQNDDLIETGFEEVPCEVFGIVDIDNEIMLYFTLDGKLVEERTRPLSMKEKHDYLPIRNMATTRQQAEEPKLYIQDGADRKTGTNDK